VPAAPAGAGVRLPPQGGAGLMTAAGEGSLTLLATTVSSEGLALGTGAALATNLQIKGLATRRQISCGASLRNWRKSHRALSEIRQGAWQ
jgi:hypothetical protein